MPPVQSMTVKKVNIPASTSLTTASAPCCDTSFTTTLAPNLANMSAYALPKPAPAPVTITVLPLNSMAGEACSDGLALRDLESQPFFVNLPI